MKMPTKSRDVSGQARPAGVRATSCLVLLVSLVVISNCSEPFESCEERRTCPPNAGQGGGVAGSGQGGGVAGSGAAGDGQSGGTAGSLASGAAGGDEDEAPDAEGGEAGQLGPTGGTAGVSGSEGALGGEGGFADAAGGSAGQGGMPEPDPCEGRCGGAKPVCDPVTQWCEECLTNSDCAAGSKPVCDPEAKQCEECLTNSDCAAGSKPACDPEAKRCVECLASGDCAASASVGGGVESPYCNLGGQVCVQCLENKHCTSSESSRCDRESGACVRCAQNSDCAHLENKGVCIEGKCGCTVARESEACGNNSCNPKTHTCTKTPRSTVGICEPCVADSECEGSGAPEPMARCVPMMFDGKWREGGFCMPRKTPGAAYCGTDGGPFPEGHFWITASKESLSGAPSEEYCGIAEEAVSCEAVLDFDAGRKCSRDADCGCPRSELGECTAPSLGGLCRTLYGQGSMSCTYRGTGYCPNNHSDGYCE